MTETQAELGPQINTEPLQGLVGYAARRASMVLLERFVQQMAPLDLRPAPFTLLSLIGANPGITSTQLCTELAIQSSNLVGLVKQLQDRALIRRQPHPCDGRAVGLHLTTDGRALLSRASQVAAQADRQATARLSEAEVRKLLSLLRKIQAADGA
jgi:DNA-binding MarR family transcriptional regulator